MDPRARLPAGLCLLVVTGKRSRRDVCTSGMHAPCGHRGAGEGGGGVVAEAWARGQELLVECHGKVRQRNADSTEQCKQAALLRLFEVASSP